MFGSIKKAIIPAAGLGTRTLPATKILPKELLPIVDKPAIQYIVEEGVAAGIEEFIFVISKGKEQIIDHFKPSPELELELEKKGKKDLLQSVLTLQEKAKFTAIYQEKPLGLGHAVLCAKEAIGQEWFFVFLPDDLIDHEIPCAVDMLNSWKQHHGAMVAVMEVLWEQVGHYGVVKALPIDSQLGKIEGVIEKPKREEAPSNLAIVGRYLLPPEIFPLIEQTKPGAIGEIQLTDALLGLVKTPKLFAFQFHGERYDVGNKAGFIEANINYALKHPETAQKTMELIKLLAESR